MMMTIEAEISRRLSYSSGKVYWKDCSKPRFNGKEAGCKSKDGYFVVKMSGKVFKLHRVVWLLCKGKWPEGWLDHIDRDKSNNSIENLREVTFSQSNANRDKASKPKLSRYKGVSKNRYYTWKATIQGTFLGCFETEHLAAAAYNKAATKIFGEHAKLNVLERYEE